MNYFEDLIYYAAQNNCSDVHITEGTAVALRKFGVLEIMEQIPSAEQSKEMILSKLTDDQKATVLSGKDLDLSIMMPDGTRLRTNIFHQRNHLAATYRILQKQIPSMEELGVPDVIRDMVDEARGLILITGPTGSGKTTTMASMVDYINKTMNKHVITVEDPIEYVYPYGKSMIHQRELGKDVASYDKALYSALREDPDIILVGEMRDDVTIRAAITAAETGHLVLSTLHTATAAQTVERIIEAFPPHAQKQISAQLANVLKGVLTQVLVPREKGDGMVMACEVLVNTDAVANQIRENKVHQIPSSIQSGGNVGMHTLDADLKRLVREWVISKDEALKFCSNPKTFLDV